MYYLVRFLKKLRLPAVKNSKVDYRSKIEGDSQFINSSMGKYSFCGYSCTILNTSIGSFCSIASNVKIGLAKHPIEWGSTSPAFYFGRDSISKRLAKVKYDPNVKKTIIGNDVWIGENVCIKQGVRIGNGSIIGMGSHIIQNKTIGKNSIVGAGTVVIDNIPDNCLSVGVPSKVKKFID